MPKGHFNIDTALRPLWPLLSPRVAPLVALLFAYRARPDQLYAALQDARVEPRLTDRLRTLIKGLYDVVKDQRWIRLYLVVSLVGVLQRTLTRLIVDRALYARKIEWSKHVVVVTGAARGIGEAVVVQLKQRGARVVAIDMADKSTLGKEDLYVKCDVTDEEALREARQLVLRELGFPTMIVSAAGLARHSFVCDPPHLFPSSYATKLHDINLSGTYNFVKIFSQDMLADYDEEVEVQSILANPPKDSAKFKPARREGQRPRNGFGGHILLIASGAAFISLPGNASYNSSKAGVYSLSQTLGLELDVWHKTNKVRNSVVCPLMVESEMTRGRMAPTRDQFLLPTLTVDDVSQAIVSTLESDRSQTIMLPAALHIAQPLVQVLPTWMLRLVLKGTHAAQDTFVGYAAKNRFVPANS